MSYLTMLPQDCLDIIFHHLQPAEKGLARISRASKQLFKAVECSTLAWAEVDGSRVLVSADDKELSSVFVAPESSARALVALNLSGLDRIRGTVLCDLFRGPTLQNKTPAISKAPPEAPTSSEEKSGLRQALQLSGSAAATEQVESPPKLLAGSAVEKPTVTKPPLSSARFGRGSGGSGGQLDGDGSSTAYVYPALSSGAVRAVKLRALDLSQCALLDPQALVAALGGCPVLEILNLNGSHACQNDWTLMHAVEALQSASSRHANRTAVGSTSTQETAGGAIAPPQPPVPLPPLPAPCLHTLRLSRSLGVGAAVPTKVRRAAASNSSSSSSTSSRGSGAGGATAAAPEEISYSRDELGFEGLAACSRGLPKLAVLALNNHVKLGDADLAPLFLGSSRRDDDDDDSCRDENKLNTKSGIAPAVALEVLEICACARVSSEMCALLLALLPLHELQANRCWRLDRTALACLNPLQLGDATNPAGGADVQAGAHAAADDGVQEQEQEEVDVFNQGGGGGGGGSQAIGAPMMESQGNTGGLNNGGAITNTTTIETAATAEGNGTATAAAMVVHNSTSAVGSFSVASNDAAMAHYRELASFVHTQVLATENPSVAAGYANARALLVVEGNAMTAASAAAAAAADDGGAEPPPRGPRVTPAHQRLKVLSVSGCEKLTGSDIASAACACSNLKQLVVAKCALQDGDLERIAAAHAVKWMTSSSSNAMTSSLSSPAYPSSPSSTNAAWVRSSGALAVHSSSSSVPSSRLLQSMASPLLPPSGLLPFAGLEVVNLSKCSDVTTAGVRTLVSAVSGTLQQLNLSDCPHVSCSFFFDLAIMAAAAPTTAGVGNTNSNSTNSSNSSSSSGNSSSSSSSSSVNSSSSSSSSSVNSSSSSGNGSNNRSSDVSVNHEVLGSLHTLNLRNLPGVSDRLMTCLLSNRAAGGCGASRLKKLFLGMSAPQRRRQQHHEDPTACAPPASAADPVVDAAARLSFVDHPAAKTNPATGSEKEQEAEEGEIEDEQLLTDVGIKTLAAGLGWGLECIDLENHTLVGDVSMLDLFKKCPRLKRLLLPGIGMGSKPLRAIAVGKRCPDLGELHVRPASKVKKQQQRERGHEEQDDDGDDDHDESEAIFDREWDAALSALRRRRPDIAKKTLQAPGSQGRACLGRWGSKEFQSGGVAAIPKDRKW